MMYDIYIVSIKLGNSFIIAHQNKRLQLTFWGRGPTGLRARARNRSRLENRSHQVEAGPTFSGH